MRFGGSLTMRGAAGVIASIMVGMGCGPKNTSTSNARPQSNEAPAATLIVINAAVWTGDEQRPKATAFAIRDGRFVGVGANDDVDRFRGAETQIIDAHGRRVIPGICDAHLHLLSGGLFLSRINLRDVPDRASFV